MRGMPSKRDLIGNSPPSEGWDYSEFEWNRIISFALGIVTTIIYFWTNLSVYLPSWTVAALTMLPVAFLHYSFTNWTWQETFKLAIGIAVGSAFAAYL